MVSDLVERELGSTSHSSDGLRCASPLPATLISRTCLSKREKRPRAQSWPTSCRRKRFYSAVPKPCARFGRGPLKSPRQTFRFCCVAQKEAAKRSSPDGYTVAP